MTLTNMQVEALPGPFGVAVSGVDLTRIDDQDFRRLLDLFYEHHVLVFRGQSFKTEQYLEFGRRWGTPKPHFQKRWTLNGSGHILLITNEAVPGRALPPAEAWHADGTYYPVPNTATMLYGVEAPAEGGETLFADTVAAYEALSPEIKTRIDGLSVKHIKNGGLRLAIDDEKALTLESQTTEEERSQVVPVQHPLVLRHPVSGRKNLYISTTSARGIAGMEEDEAVELLISLKRHALEPRFRSSYKTLPGELLVWDNLSVIHKAGFCRLSNELGERRVLHRISVTGLPPCLQGIDERAAADALAVQP